MEESVSAEVLRRDLRENLLPIAKALLELSRSMSYEKVEVVEGSLVAALILEAAKELRAVKVKP